MDFTLRHLPAWLALVLLLAAGGVTGAGAPVSGFLPAAEPAAEEGCDCREPSCGGLPMEKGCCCHSPASFPSLAVTASGGPAFTGGREAHRLLPRVQPLPLSPAASIYRPPWS